MDARVTSDTAVGAGSQRNGTECQIVGSRKRTEAPQIYAFPSNVLIENTDVQYNANFLVGQGGGAIRHARNAGQ